MNHEQNEIDDIFKNGLENQSTPYKNEYWNLMEEMLDEKRSSVYGLGYKKWLTFVGLSSLILVMILIGNGSNYNENINAKSNDKLNYPFVLPIVSHSVSTFKVSNQILLKDKQPKFQSKNLAPKKQQVVLAFDNIIYNQELASKENIGNKLANLDINTQKCFDFSFKNNNLLNDAFVQNEKIILEENKSISNSYLTKNTNKEISNKSNIDNPKSTENENVLFEKKQPNQIDGISKINKKNASKKINNTEVVSVANLDFHILGGLTIGNAFNSSNTEKNVTKMGFMAGFGFGYYFNKKVSLSMDIMYQKRNGHDLERKVTSEEFFLYKKSQTYTLKTYNTDYLVLPIQLKYQFKKHHAFGLGVYTNFLLNSYNTIYLSTLTTNNTSKIEESNDKVNYGNWETVNYGYSLNYEFNPNKNIGIGIGYYKGMKDATINSFYRNDKKDIMSDFTLTLKYYLK